MRRDKEQNMYFENRDYFGNPNMMNPMMPMGPNMPMNNMNYSPGMPNVYPTNYPYNSNNDYNTLEQRVNRIERQLKRIDSRIARLESKNNIVDNEYHSTTDGYNVNETNLYMM